MECSVLVVKLNSRPLCINFTNVSFAPRSNFQEFSSALSWVLQIFAKKPLKAAKKYSPTLLFHTTFFYGSVCLSESQQGSEIRDVISAQRLRRPLRNSEIIKIFGVEGE